ncbi:MAG: hypothetical protein WBK77_04185 [Alphaproteobacteria bacterium]
MNSERKNAYREIPKHLRELAAAHDVSLKLIQDHLSKPTREMEEKGYSPAEIASAYLILARYALCNNYDKEKIDKTFEILSDFARRRVEEAMKHKKKQKSRSLH